MARSSMLPIASDPSLPHPARRFLALRPPPATSETLAATRDALHGAARDGRPVATDRLHLTLAFLGIGPYDADTIARVQGALDGLDALAFELVLDRVGSFEIGHRHVGWIGPRVAPVALERLVEAIRTRFAAHAITFDARPFVPHVTVLRGLAAPLADRPIAPIRWPVDRFDLLASRLDRARYETVASWHLAGGAHGIGAR
jgi:2'-5' RNA ligase